MEISNAHQVNGIRPSAPVERKQAPSTPEQRDNLNHDEVILSQGINEIQELAKGKNIALERIKVLPEVRSSLLTQAKERMAQGFYSTDDFRSKLSESLMASMFEAPEESG